MTRVGASGLAPGGPDLPRRPPWAPVLPFCYLGGLWLGVAVALRVLGLDVALLAWGLLVTPAVLVASLLAVGLMTATQRSPWFRPAVDALIASAVGLVVPGAVAAVLALALT